MRIQTISALAFVSPVFVRAFPAALFGDYSKIEEFHKRNPDGGLLGGLLDGLGDVITGLIPGYTLGDTVNGLLNGSLPGLRLPGVEFPGLGNISIEVPQIVTIGRKKIPDDDHPFIAPKPTDQRGGCPGLNILANYGYIDRSGVTTATELLWAQQEALGLAPDLAVALVGLTAISSLDFTSLKLSIGNADTRTNGPLSGILGQVPGIFDKAIHNTYEVDGSVAYTDSAFTTDGNTNHFNSTKWAQTIAIAEAAGGFGPKWVAEARYQHYLECVRTNPTCLWEKEQLVFYLAGAFPQVVVTSADLNGVPLPPDIKPVSQFWGVKKNADGTFSHVPETLPPSSDGHWYRRSVPLTFAQLAVLGVEAYAAHPVVFGSNSGKPNTFTGSPNQLGDALNAKAFCLVFNELQANIPGPLKSVQKALVTFVNILLAPAKQSLGC